MYPYNFINRYINDYVSFHQSSIIDSNQNHVIIFSSSSFNIFLRFIIKLTLISRDVCNDNDYNFFLSFSFSFSSPETDWKILIHSLLEQNLFARLKILEEMNHTMRVYECIAKRVYK